LQVDGVWASNEKRTAFLEYLDLPKRTTAKLELALTLGHSEDDEAERLRLEQNGWQVRCLWTRSDWTSQAYRDYVLHPGGEFSCAKPLYVHLQAALVFDRTLHYLASGKPVIVQHTGPSSILPDAEGIFRFRTPQEAVSAIQAAEADYSRHGRLARSLAEELDSRKVIQSVLERSL
jgi:hypothetical protein